MADVSDLESGELQIVPEAEYTLVSRDFIPGDVVKRSLTAVESAVVSSVRSEVRLHHAIAKDREGGWIPFDQVQNALKIEARDKVFCDEWIGTVEEVSSMVLA